MYSNPLNYGSNLVGVIRLELMTSSLSVKCSNHLSYTPKLCCFCLGQHNGQHINHEEFFDRAFGPHNCVEASGFEPKQIESKSIMLTITSCFNFHFTC